MRGVDGERIAVDSVVVHPTGGWLYATASAVATLQGWIIDPGTGLLTGAPWNPAIADSMLQEVRDAILWNALTSSGPLADGGFRAPRTGCSK